MARRYLTAILAAAIAASFPASSFAADAAQCQYAAREWAASVPHMSHRVKVPLWTLVGVLAGRPGWFAVLAANAESPRERRMIASYEEWCMGGFAGEHPSVPPRWLELF